MYLYLRHAGEVALLYVIQGEANVTMVPIKTGRRYHSRCAWFNDARCRVRDNEITDLGPLESLANLRELDLGSNSVADLSHLADHANVIPSETAVTEDELGNLILVAIRDVHIRFDYEGPHPIAQRMASG